MRRAAASAARKLEPGTIRIAGFLGALLLLFGALTSFPAKGTETPPPATGSAEVPESLKRAGWRLLEVPGKAKAEFHDAYADAIRLKAENAVAFLYRPVDSESKLSGRLSWRWRVDQAVPPTDLSRPIGDDRTLAVHIVFPMDENGLSFWEQMKLDVTRLVAPPLAGRVLTYVWGGSAPAGTILDNPHLDMKGKLIILRNAEEPLGRWVMEDIDFNADFKQAFGEMAPSPSHIAISTDSDDTGSRARGAIAGLAFEG